MPDITTLLISGGVAFALGVVGFFSGSAFRRKSAEKTIGSAETEAKRILNDAMKTAETRKKETLLEAKGFDECIAIINEPSVNVVVKSIEELSVAQVAQIQNIVMREANAKAQDIHIVTKK